MRHERQAVVDQILRIPTVTQGDLKRAIYQIRIKDGCCANAYCARKAAPGGVLCTEHRKYQADYRSRKKPG